MSRPAVPPATHTQTRPQTRPTRRTPRVHRWLTPVAAAAALAAAVVPAGATDYVWGNGSASSIGLPAAITINDTLEIGCFANDCGTKQLNQDFTNNGSTVATDHLYFYYYNRLQNNWTYELRGDVGLFDQFGGNLFDNRGVLVKSQGAGSSVITVGSSHSATASVDAVHGTIDFAGGTHVFAANAFVIARDDGAIRFSGGSSATFADGVRFAGNGQFTLAANANVQGAIGAQHLRFENAAWTGGSAAPGSFATLTSDARWGGNGRLEGAWKTDAGSTLTLEAGGAKYLGSTATLEHHGTLVAHDDLRFWYYSRFDNRGTVQLDGDVGLYETFGGSLFDHQGTLAKTAGTGVSQVAVAFRSSNATIAAHTGTLDFVSGAATFGDGTVFKGAGQVRVSNAATFVGAIGSENLLLTGASFTGGDGTPGSGAVLSGRAAWAGNGRLEGTWRTAAGSTLALQGTGAKVLGSSAVWTNDGSVTAGDDLRLWYYSRLVNHGTWDLAGDVGFWETYGGSQVTNTGLVRKTAGSGAGVVTASFYGTGTSRIEVQAGTLDFRGGSHRFDSGAGFLAVAGSAVTFSGGDVTLADGVLLDGPGTYTLAANATVLGALGAQQLRLQNASWTGGDTAIGSRAALTSDAQWSGNGRLEGAWRHTAHRTLALQDAGAKYLGASASLVNEGTIAAGDHLHFWYYSGLDNLGTYRLDGDVGLYETFGGSAFINRGTLAKAAGSGVSQVAVAFSNTGTVQVDSGTLDFTSGSNTFGAGTRFTGAGSVRVSSAASFSGRFDAQRLLLDGASFNGDNALLASGQATLQRGTRLEGQWRIGSGAQLALQAGGTPVVGSFGQLVIDGTLAAAAPLQLWYYSRVLNNGTWTLDGDVGFSETFGGSAVTNHGLIAKTAGSGEAAFAATFSNAGTVRVDAGSIRLPDHFVNDGTLAGRGTFTTPGTLTNQGHLAPGASPGTLTLNGDLLLGSAGTLDIELQDAARHDRLLVSGNVTLGGTLALSLYCAPDCHLAAGSDLLILDGQGSLTGSFDAVTLQGFAPGTFSVVVDGAQADVWLHVNQAVGAVPEPEVWALWFAGLGALALLRRRRME